LAKKGNVLNDPSSPMPKGKQGMNVENLKAPLPYSIVDGHTVDDLVFKNDLNFDVVTCHSLIDDIIFAWNDGKKNNVFGNCDADEFVIEIINIRHLQDKKTYKPFHLLDLSKNVHSLIFYEKLLCLNKNVRMRFEMHECLKTCMSLICLFDTRMTCKMVSALKVEDGVSNLPCCINFACLKKPLLFLTKNDQNRVFKPGASYLKLLINKGEYSNFVWNKYVESSHLFRILSLCVNRCVNHLCLLDVMTLNLKTKLLNYDKLQTLNRSFGSTSLFKVFKSWIFVVQNYNSRMLLVFGISPTKKFLTHCGKVKSTFTFDPGIGSFVQFLHKILRRPFELINQGVTNLFNFCVGDTSKWFPPKKGAYKHKLCPTQGMSDLQVFGSNYANSIDKRAGDNVKFFSRKWPDLGTNRFKEGGNDVSTPGASSSANQDLNELPKGPITQAYAKHFLEAILASNAKPWFETRAKAHKISLKQLSKGPVHCWQADPSSFLAPRAPSSSTQLI